MSLTEMGLVKHERDPRDLNDFFIGGEENGRVRLKQFLSKQRFINTYDLTRNSLDGNDFSSKLSPWLANGSLSMREVYFAVLDFERIHG